jgi:hypothetical protein
MTSPPTIRSRGNFRLYVPVDRTGEATMSNANDHWQTAIINYLIQRKNRSSESTGHVGRQLGNYLYSRVKNTSNDANCRVSACRLVTAIRTLREPLNSHGNKARITLFFAAGQSLTPDSRDWTQNIVRATDTAL